MLIALGSSPAFSSQNLPRQYHPLVGGSGGQNYTLSCGPGKVLAGLFNRTGVVIDRIGILCKPVLSDGSLGGASQVGGSVGGNGGSSRQVDCYYGSAVSGIWLYTGSYVDGVKIRCKSWDKAKKQFTPGGTEDQQLFGSNPLFTDNHLQSCYIDIQPGAGIRVRAASVVDAVGLMCDEP